MNDSTDTQSSSSEPTISSEITVALKRFEKLDHIVSTLQDSINLTSIRDLASRVSNLEEKVDRILHLLESRKNS